jgi:hypothetical protein
VAAPPPAHAASSAESTSAALSERVKGWRRLR